MSASNPAQSSNGTPAVRALRAASHVSPTITSKSVQLLEPRAAAPVPTHSYKQSSQVFSQPLPTRNPSPGTLSRFVHYQDPSFVFPFGSTGRGFLTRPGRPTQPRLDQSVTVATHVPILAGRTSRGQFDPMQFARTSQVLGHRTHLHQNPHLFNAPPTGSMPVKDFPGVVQSKVVTPASSVPGLNEHKTSRDDFVVVRDRKVRITEGDSLYALSRSWLRNGIEEGKQLRHESCIIRLPRPQPPFATNNDSQVKDDEEGQTEEEEKEFVEHLQARELLQGHIKRAKKVRARLREDRLKHIRRYGNRLALLLPPLVEQCQNESH